MDLARETFLHALGIDLKRLDPHQRATIEALSEEILSLRMERDDMATALAAAEQLADHDTLVPVFNRRAFMRELKREIALAERFATPLTLIYLDLDGFKAVNDTFGHATGDDVLRRVAALLRANIRDTDILARLGGDEFGILLAQAEAAAARTKATELSRLVGRLRVRGGANRSETILAIGASYGVCQWRSGLSPDLLVSQADAAMYAEKRRRRQSQERS